MTSTTPNPLISIITCTILFYSISLTLGFFSSYVLSKKNYNFRFPLFITAMQNIIHYLLANLFIFVHCKWSEKVPENKCDDGEDSNKSVMIENNSLYYDIDNGAFLKRSNKKVGLFGDRCRSGRFIDDIFNNDQVVFNNVPDNVNDNININFMNYVDKNGADTRNGSICINKEANNDRKINDNRNDNVDITIVKSKDLKNRENINFMNYNDKNLIDTQNYSIDINKEANNDLNKKVNKNINDTQNDNIDNTKVKNNELKNGEKFNFMNYVDKNLIDTQNCSIDINKEANNGLKIKENINDTQNDNVDIAKVKNTALNINENMNFMNYVDNNLIDIRNYNVDIKTVKNNALIKKVNKNINDTQNDNIDINEVKNINHKIKEKKSSSFFNYDIPPYIITTIPCAITAAIDIGMSSHALRTVSLAFYTMIKSSAPVFVLLSSFLFGIEKPSVKLFFIIFTIGSGVFITTMKTQNMKEELTSSSFIGICLNNATILLIIASFMAGFRWAFVQYLIEKRRVRKKNVVYTIRDLCLPIGFILFLFSCYFEGLNNIINSEFFKNRLYITRSVLFIVLSGMLSFLLIVSEFLLVSKTSVVFLSVSGIVKEMIIVFISVCRNEIKFEGINYVGLIVSVVGMVMYSLCIKSKKIDGTGGD